MVYWYYLRIVFMGVRLGGVEVRVVCIVLFGVWKVEKGDCVFVFVKWEVGICLFWVF